MNTQEKATHTPAPWRIGAAAGFSDEKHPMNIMGSTGQSVADTDRNVHMSQEEKEANATFIVCAVNSHEALLEFAKKHHEVCGDCEGTGKVYNNADPTSGQWVACPYGEAIARAEGK